MTRHVGAKAAIKERAGMRRREEQKKRYGVSSAITISIYTEVEARTPEEARKKALERGMLALCHQCAEGEPEREWVTSGDLDGEPEGVDDDNIVELE